MGKIVKSEQSRIWRQVNHNPLHFFDSSLNDDEEVALCACRIIPLLIKNVSDRLLMSESFLLQAVRKHPECLMYAMDTLKKKGLPDEFHDFRDDYEFMLKAVRINGNVLRYASLRLREDMELSYEAVKRSGIVLKWAGLAPRSDCRVLRAAYRQNKKAIGYASIKICRDKNKLLYITDGNISKTDEIRQCVNQVHEEEKARLLQMKTVSYHDFPDFLKQDYDFMESLVEKFPGLLREDIKEQVNARPRMVLRILKKYAEQGKWLQAEEIAPLLDDRFLNNKRYALLLVNTFGMNLQYVSKRLRDDKRVVLCAVTGKNRRSMSHTADESVHAPLEFASDRLRDNDEIVEMAIKSNARNIAFASDRLRDSESFAYLAINRTGEAEDTKGYTVVSCLSERLRNDRAFMTAVVLKYGMYLPIKYASESLRGDRDFVMFCVRQNGHALQYAAEKLKDDIEIVNASDFDVLKYASERLRNDKKFVMEYLKKHPWDLRYVSERLRDDEDVVLVAVQKRADIMCYASERLKHKKDMCM